MTKLILSYKLIPHISLKHNRALIIDAKGNTLAQASDLKEKPSKHLTKSQRAREVGFAIAQMAKKLKIKRALLIRGHRKYHGRLKQLAEGARAGELEL